MALLDEGSELVVIREDVWKKTQAPINKDIRMRMQTANGSSQGMSGCLEMLEIDVDGIKTWAHACVIADAPYRLLLGRPWQRLVRLESVDFTKVNAHFIILSFLTDFHPSISTIFWESLSHDKIRKLHKACERHVQLTKECSQGLGQDRSVFLLAVPRFQY
jgi:hypothetical protein